mgnify:CR=1 FL=1
MLPPVIKRQDIACFGVTEPNTGLDTTRLTTRAVRKGDRYIVHGLKIWTTTAQVANKILLIARTTPEELLLLILYARTFPSVVVKAITTHNTGVSQSARKPRQNTNGRKAAAGPAPYRVIRRPVATN